MDYEFKRKSLLSTEVAKLKKEFDMIVHNNKEECENQIMYFFNDETHIEFAYPS